VAHLFNPAGREPATASEAPTRIADVLRNKSSAVTQIGQDTTVAELLDRMAEHNVEAMAVLGRDGPIGIVSEREVAWKLLMMQGTGLRSLPVSAFITRARLTCTPEDAIRDIGERMIEHRVRHASVISGGALVGIVSIDDVVTTRRGAVNAEQEKRQSPQTRE
jgi:CBS domain-containing protein